MFGQVLVLGLWLCSALDSSVLGEGQQKWDGCAPGPKRSYFLVYQGAVDR